MDAVATARRAGRLLGLTAQLADAWARERPRGSPECKAAVAEAADLAVGRMRAVLEGEVDRLYLMAFAAANARVGVASSRAGYAAAIAAADELEAAAAGGWWRQRAPAAPDRVATARPVTSEPLIRKFAPFAPGADVPTVGREERLEPGPGGGWVRRPYQRHIDARTWARSRPQQPFRVGTPHPNAVTPASAGCVAGSHQSDGRPVGSRLLWVPRF